MLFTGTLLFTGVRRPTVLLVCFLIKKLIFDIPNENYYENSMGDFWAESIRLASPATERFLYAFWDRVNLDWVPNFFACGELF